MKSKKRSKKTVRKVKPAFDKYEYYLHSVQSPEMDCAWIARLYKQIKNRNARILREDFCAGFAICCAWVQRDPKNHALGIDLDPEPLAYGKVNYLSQLKKEEQKRVHIYQDDVLKARLPKADMTIAFNFSYYFFKRRKQLVDYFKKVRQGLNSKGIFIVDCFGGMGCGEANVESSKHRGPGGYFEYFWDQMNFNPITNEGKFHIHFKRKGEKIRQRVFTYDWRLWTIPEIREAMIEAGFRKAHVYWEGTDRKGEGNGRFRRTEKGEECESWVSYLIAEV